MPSDGDSKKIFPHNTRSQFQIPLQEPMNCSSGNWEAAILDVSIPKSLFNLSTDFDRRVGVGCYHRPAQKKSARPQEGFYGEIVIPAGKYSPESFCKALNEQLKLIPLWRTQIGPWVVPSSRSGHKKKPPPPPNLRISAIQGPQKEEEENGGTAIFISKKEEEEEDEEKKADRNIPVSKQDGLSPRVGDSTFSTETFDIIHLEDHRIGDSIPGPPTPPKQLDPSTLTIFSQEENEKRLPSIGLPDSFINSDAPGSSSTTTTTTTKDSEVIGKAGSIQDPMRTEEDTPIPKTPPPDREKRSLSPSSTDSDSNKKRKLDSDDNEEVLLLVDDNVEESVGTKDIIKNEGNSRDDEVSLLDIKKVVAPPQAFASPVDVDRSPRGFQFIDQDFNFWNTKPLNLETALEASSRLTPLLGKVLLKKRARIKRDTVQTLNKRKKKQALQQDPMIKEMMKSQQVPTRIQGFLKPPSEKKPWKVGGVGITASYSAQTEKLSFTFNGEDGTWIHFINPNLRYMLGFGENQSVELEKIPQLGKTRTLEHLCQLNCFVEDMYIYSDFVEWSAIGGIRAPFMLYNNISSILNTNSFTEQGSSHEIVIASPKYISVQPKVLSHLGFRLTDSSSAALGFLTGRVVITLHFKRKNNKR